MSISRQLHQQQVVIDTGTVTMLRYKKERNPAATWTNLENTVLSERSQSQKGKYCRRSLEELNSETESRMGPGAGAGEGE